MRSNNGSPTSVYAMQAGDTNLVKIGLARDVQKRRRELQTGSGHRLRVLASARFQDRETARIAERMTRDYFTDTLHAKRGEGEWIVLDGLDQRLAAWHTAPSRPTHTRLCKRVMDLFAIAAPQHVEWARRQSALEAAAWFTERAVKSGTHALRAGWFVADPHGLIAEEPHPYRMVMDEMEASRV